LRNERGHEKSLASPLGEENKKSVSYIGVFMVSLKRLHIERWSIGDAAVADSMQ